MTTTTWAGPEVMEANTVVTERAKAVQDAAAELLSAAQTDVLLPYTVIEVMKSLMVTFVNLNAFLRRIDQHNDQAA